MLRHVQESSVSDGDSVQQHAAAADTVARSMTPDSDDSHQTAVVPVPPLDKTVFESWNEFHEYLHAYQQRTFQIYSIRTGTPVSTRNKRIKDKYSRRGLAVPPGELLPEELVTYSKAVVCTHHGRPRSRAAGVRARQPSRAINCPAQITLVLRRNYTSGKCFVHVSSHTARHNHALSDGQYRRHPMIRKITDPGVLRTVHTLQKANVEPAKILKYVREHTDKEVMLKDVHNMLASFRKSPPASTTTTTARAVPARSVAVVRPPAQLSAPPERPPHFSGRIAPQPSPPAPPPREFLTRYDNFLAAFNIGKEIAELMAEMDSDRFAHCLAELRTFLRILESGRVPVVTTREAIKQRNNGLTSISNTEQTAFRLAAPRSSIPPHSDSGEATNSLISPSQSYPSAQ
ncbi:hypothetical protein V7S43_014630 [Phytophthora oleae]|uniref:FAR1 domain-containing protein n=1 Tax=Phytophthora oleae TaxID=2107226 RepID=A0ABD3F392_9STRA